MILFATENRKERIYLWNSNNWIKKVYILNGKKNCVHFTPNKKQSKVNEHIEQMQELKQKI